MATGLALLCLAPALFAQLPEARLDTLFPCGAAAGTTVAVVVKGTDLEGAGELRFSHPGISAQLETNAADSNSQAKFRVTVSHEVAPGLYDARVRGRFGLSNPRAFAVSGLREMSETERHESTSQALAVTVGTVVNSHTYPDAVNYYSVPLQRSQRILIGCQARALDSRLDPVLVLLDDAGREMAAERQKTQLDFIAPANAQYLIAVHDRLYHGGEEYFYRLNVSGQPRVDSVYPPVAVGGKSQKCVFWGPLLAAKTIEPGSGSLADHLELEIEAPGHAACTPPEHASELVQPATATLDTFDFRLKTALGLADAIAIPLVPPPLVVDNFSSDVATESRKLVPPCSVVGRFQPPEAPDWCWFEAKKGTVYWLEVLSNRLGLPTAPFILVQRASRNAKGVEQYTDVLEFYGSDQSLDGLVFLTASHDPVGRFVAPADGLYRLRVRDLFHPGRGGPSLAYVLEVRPETPEFHLVALPEAPPPANPDAKVASVWSAVARRGETVAIKVIACRQDGFAGEIALAATNLPAGVVAGVSKIEAGKSSGLLWLTAGEHAADWAGPLRIIGRAKSGQTTLEHEAREGVVVWNVGDYNNEPVFSRLAREAMLSVCGAEVAPITIRPAQLQGYSLASGAKLQIPLRIQHHFDLNGGLNLKVVGDSALAPLKPLAVDAKATNAILEIDSAEARLTPGTHTFHLEGQTTVKYRNNPEAAELAQAAATKAEEELARCRAAAKQAAQAVTRAKTAAAAASADVEQAATLGKTAKAEPTHAGEKADTVGASTNSTAKAAAVLAKADARKKSAAEVLAAAEESLAGAQAKVKAAEADKTAATQRAKAAAEHAKPRDVAYVVYSEPITLRVTEVTGLPKK